MVEEMDDSSSDSDNNSVCVSSCRMSCVSPITSDNSCCASESSHHETSSGESGDEGDCDTLSGSCRDSQNHGHQSNREATPTPIMYLQKHAWHC